MKKNRTLKILVSILFLTIILPSPISPIQGQVSSESWKINMTGIPEPIGTPYEVEVDMWQYEENADCVYTTQKPEKVGDYGFYLMGCIVNGVLEAKLEIGDQVRAYLIGSTRLEFTTQAAAFEGPWSGIFDATEPYSRNRQVEGMIYGQKTTPTQTLISVSYVLGYDMLFQEQKAVPLRTRFELKDSTETNNVNGITRVQIARESLKGQKDCAYYSEVGPTGPECIFGNLSPIPVLEYEKPVQVAEYDFLILNTGPNTGWDREFPFSVDFEVKLELDKRIKEEVKFTVVVEAPYSVYVVKEGIDPNGAKHSVGLVDFVSGEGDSLPLGKWVKITPRNLPFWRNLALDMATYDTRVLVRYLNGMVAMFIAPPSADFRVRVGLNFEKVADMPKTTDTSFLEIVSTAAQDQIADKMLEVLLKKTAGGAVGIILDPEPLGGSPPVSIRLRSLVGVTVGTNGVVTVRNFEGAPEIIQPDRTVLSLPVGYESTNTPDGTFAPPSPYNPTDSSVSVWGEYVTTGTVTTRTEITEGDQDDDDSGGGTMLILVVVMLGVVLFVMMRRRGRAHPSPTKAKTTARRRPSMPLPGKRPSLTSTTQTEPVGGFCTNCGARVSHQVRFCEKCGAPVTRAS